LRRGALTYLGVQAVRHQLYPRALQLLTTIPYALAAALDWRYHPRGSVRLGKQQEGQSLTHLLPGRQHLQPADLAHPFGILEVPTQWSLLLLHNLSF